MGVDSDILVGQLLLLQIMGLMMMGQLLLLPLLLEAAAVAGEDAVEQEVFDIRIWTGNDDRINISRGFGKTTRK